MPTWPRGSGYVGARAQTKPRADYAFAPDDENASRHPEPEGISAVRVALCEIDGPVTFSEHSGNCSDEAFYILQG